MNLQLGNIYIYIYIQVLPTGLFRTCLQVYTVEGLRKSSSHIKAQLAADKKCPQWKEQRQTTTPGSLPYSARSVWVLSSPAIEGSRDWTYGLTSISVI